MRSPRESMLPAIYFLFSRNDCQAFAERLAVMRPGSGRPTPRQARSKHVLETYLDGAAPGRPRARTGQVDHPPGAARASGSTTPGCCRPQATGRSALRRGLMQVVFATDTLALGVNMPARTVVIGRMSKWDGAGAGALDPERVPADGRAGRAPRHGRVRACGRALFPLADLPRDAGRSPPGRSNPVQSAFAIRYNTVLNLWDPPRWRSRAADAPAEPGPVPDQPAHPPARRRHHRDRRRHRRHPEGRLIGHPMASTICSRTTGCSIGSCSRRAERAAHQDLASRDLAEPIESAPVAGARTPGAAQCSVSPAPASSCTIADFGWVDLSRRGPRRESGFSSSLDRKIMCCRNTARSTTCRIERVRAQCRSN